MTAFNRLLSIAAALAVVGSGLALSISAANAAGGAKEFFVQDYQFKKPMHGYSGYSNNYYCDYQRLPNRQCFTKRDGTEKCVILGWTLREMCQ
jgi:hypothetical protein